MYMYIINKPKRGLALLIRSNHPLSYYKLGFIYANAKQYDVALDYFTFCFDNAEKFGYKKSIVVWNIIDVLDEIDWNASQEWRRIAKFV